MKHALKIGYDGSRFHGSQRQSDDDPDSIEGTLVNAMRKIGSYEKGDWPVEFSSRTDAGVSALGNVVAVESEMDPVDLMKALNANMEGVWCIGSGKMREHQNIRWAASRWYRYHLKPGVLNGDQVKILDSTLAEYVGLHDFTNFCKLEEGKDPKTIIQRANALDMTGNGEMVVVDIVGERFLWNQVRRMVGAALKVAEGKMSKEVFASLLSGEDSSKKNVIPTMPATGLVLMDVAYKDIDFILDPGAIDLAKARSSQDSWQATVKVLLHSALRSLRY
jgi:tRNA pseudouridine38-40 synthase